MRAGASLRQFARRTMRAPRGLQWPTAKSAAVVRPECVGKNRVSGSSRPTLLPGGPAKDDTALALPEFAKDCARIQNWGRELYSDWNRTRAIAHRGAARRGG